jgi:glycine cleavage system T protein
MATGETELDLREANCHRFHAHALSKKYIAIRSTQQYREVYDIIHPLQQMENPRRLRLSPFHNRLEAQKGVFFESAGWEVAQWYGENQRLLEQYEARIPQRSGWEARQWSPVQGAEHLAVRDQVGLFNLAAFTKIEVSGPGAMTYLEYLAANKIDRPIGTIVYTSMLDTTAGIKCDLTITRLETNRFLVLTGGGTGPQDLAWLRQCTPDDGSVSIQDVTSGLAAVGLWGPRARHVLENIAEGDVSNEAFPYFTARRLKIDTVPALALRLSYAGELGWELYCPTEYARHLWDVLWEAGQPHGMSVAGGGAFNSLRLEKGYRLWGSDIHTEYNPYEAGLGWAVQLNKGEFIGREALLKIKEEGVGRKLCCLTLDEPDAMALGKEPIMNDGRALGYVTSTDYGYSVGKHIVYGYLPLEFAKKGTQVDVMYFGRRQPATVSDDPLFDPQMTRLRV